MSGHKNRIIDAAAPIPEPKWELFAQNLASGKTLTDSYMEAGYKIKRHGAATQGAQLYRKPLVRARVDYLQNERIMTRQEIAELYTEACRDPSAAMRERVKAATELCKMQGYVKGPTPEPDDTYSDKGPGSPEWNRRMAAVAQSEAKTTPPAAPMSKTPPDDMQPADSE